MKIKPVGDRFWDKVSPEPNSGCWLWIGAVDGHGYGQLAMPGNKKRLATHVALEVHGRPRKPEAPCALHKCDNPACVNPDHLEWGTMKRNTKQMIERGRNNFTGLEAGRERLRKRRLVVACHGCGISLNRTRAQVRPGKKSFCSNSCLTSWQKKTYTGKSRSEWGWGKNA